MASIFYFFGMISAAAACYFGYAADRLDVSVDGVANGHLMHIQALQFALALAAGIVAAVLLSAGGIIQVLRERSRD